MTGIPCVLGKTGNILIIIHTPPIPMLYGMDHDISGYGVMRMSREQAWEPRFCSTIPMGLFLSTGF